MNIWIDIKMPHEPLFFKSFINYFDRHNFQLTSRDYAEINQLLDKYQMEYKCIGNRPIGNLLLRKIHFFLRVMQLFINVNNYEIALSHMSVWSIYASKFKMRSNIAFYDNDISILNSSFFKHTDYLFTPDAIPIKKLIEQGASKESIFRYKGYKEDIYVADYIPDIDFLSSIPFSNFVSIRPENLDATYVKKGTISLIPELFSEFKKSGINVLYLPRTETDKSYSRFFPNVFVPTEPLNGLDICYYSSVVLTGSGTMAREAACMGTAAISFFPENLLAVDEKMVSEGRMYHSRNAKEIIAYVKLSKKRKFDNSGSKKVQKEVFNKLDSIFQNHEKNLSN